MQTKRCLKLAARVRDIDKQYELNNNADLDNGVYHKLELPLANKEEDQKEIEAEGEKLKSPGASSSSTFGKRRKDLLPNDPNNPDVVKHLNFPHLPNFSDHHNYPR